jgi:hypothetical protein
MYRLTLQSLQGSSSVKSVYRRPSERQRLPEILHSIGCRAQAGQCSSETLAKQGSRRQFLLYLDTRSRWVPSRARKAAGPAPFVENAATGPELSREGGKVTGSDCSNGRHIPNQDGESQEFITHVIASILQRDSLQLTFDSTGWERRRNYATDQRFWTLTILGR